MKNFTYFQLTLHKHLVKTLCLIAIFISVLNLSTTKAQVDLHIDNITVSGTNLTFDLFLTATSSSFGLNASDFALDFNASQFTSPTITRLSNPTPIFGFIDNGYCTFISTDFTGPQGDPALTNTVQVPYFNNTSASITGNTVLINLNAISPSNAANYNQFIAIIDNVSSTHRLGRFTLSGYNGTDDGALSGLSWNTGSTSVNEVLNNEPNFTVQAVSINSATVNLPSPTPEIEIETDAACYGTAGFQYVFTLIGSDGLSPSRNIYSYTYPDFSGGATSTISWNSANNRWEVIYNGNTLDLWSDYASAPNPPDLATGNWQSDPFCGAAIQFGGSGTQDFLGTALPVELTYFQAKKDGKTSLLTWETASEENNKGFYVEHSINGRDFDVIDWVEGNGNTIEVQEYEFTHEKPNIGVNYYRLVQEDFDGTTSYSDIRTVTFESDFGIRVYPNPSKLRTGTNIQFVSDNDQTININVFEIDGKQIMSMKHNINKGNNTLSLPHDVLSNGIYIISITHNGGTENVKLSIVE